MQTIRANGTTDADGTLTLALPLGRPNAEFEAVVVVQPRSAEEGPLVDPWAAVNTIRGRLAASGKAFTDSAELIREDRDR